MFIYTTDVTDHRDGKLGLIVIGWLTDAELGLVVFACELVTVAKNDLTTPNIQDGADGQIAALVELFVNGTRLKSIVVHSVSMARERNKCTDVQCQPLSCLTLRLSRMYRPPCCIGPNTLRTVRLVFSPGFSIDETAFGRRPLNTKHIAQN